MEELQNFSLEENGSVKTDFAPGTDCYQKVVKFCHDGSKLVTGGMEGVMRVWRVSLCVCYEVGGGGIIYRQSCITLITIFSSRNIPHL